MPGWLNRLWYYFVWVICFWTLTLGFSYRTLGRGRFPRRGPVLIIANHQSFLDPILVDIAIARPTTQLARKSLFANRFFAGLIVSLGAVPVDQEGVGKEGIKAILRNLEEGRVVVVYPEGNRTPDGNMQDLKPGISLLIKRVQAAIVPMGLAGAHSAWPRTQLLPVFAPLFMPPEDRTIAVVVGQPLDGRRYAEMERQQMLDELFAEMQKVQEAAEELRRK
jgi:1-acyl-sn-glycerol-3-phosphate acyltransferase